MTESVVKWLQDWYVEMCDGLWEHQYGVTIETVDNPGWSVDIDLKKEIYGQFSIELVSVENNEHDWFFYEVREGTFGASGGPRNLIDILLAFQSVINNRKLVQKR